MKMNDINVQEIRKELGLTQEQLAEKLGVHTRTIQNWENGGTIPQSKHAMLRGLLPQTHIVYGGQHVQSGDAINGDKYVEEVKTQEDVEEIRETVNCDVERLLKLLEANQKSLDSLIAQQGRYLTIIENLSNPRKND